MRPQPFLVGLCCLAGGASATPIEVFARGENVVGITTQFVLRYESSTTPTPYDENTDLYFGAFISMRVWVDGRLELDMDNPESFNPNASSILVSNDNVQPATGRLFDGIQFLADDTDPDSDGLFILRLRDFTATAFEETSLPTSMQYDQFNDFWFGLSTESGDSYNFRLRFLEAYVVPAPSALLGISVGALAVGRRRRM